MSRVLTTGFEFSGAADNGIDTLHPEITITSTNPRRSAGNNGGIRALEANTTGVREAIFQQLPHLLPESYFRIYTKITSTVSTHEYIFYDVAGATNIFKLSFSTPTGPLVLNVNGSDVATGITNFSLDTYYSIKVYALIDAAGDINVEIDGVSDITYSGATNGAGTGWDQLKLNTDGTVFYDDMAINDTYTVIRYDGGNGTLPTAGSNIFGSGPGVATIISHFGDGTDGYMVINKSSGSFSDNDTYSQASHNAVILGAEDTSSTGTLPEGFIQLFYPDGNGNSSDLTNSDTTQINNYTYVDSFEDSNNFVFDEIGGVGDTYTMEDLPAEALAVNHVDACFFTQKDGSTLNNIRSTLRISGTDYDSYTAAIPSSRSWVKISYQLNPDTDTDWTLSDINNLEAGPKLEV